MSNTLSFVGTVTRDAEVTYLPSGGAVLNVSVANNQGFGEKQKTLFIRVALFGKRAEGQLKEYLVKGQQVFVSGELSQSEYTAQDGSTRTNLELNANVLDLVGKRAENGQYSEQKSGSNARTQESRPFIDEEFSDDIPF